MTSESDELQMLGRARKLLSPAPSAVERVWQATHAQIASQAVHVGAEQPAFPRPGLATTSLANKWLAGGAIALVAGAIGFCAGFDLGRRQTAGAARHTQAEQPALAVPTALHQAPSPAPTAHAEVEASASASTAPAVSARPLRRARQAVAPEVPPSAPTAPAALTLAQEVEILKRVERALREGEPGAALELLDDMEQRGASAMLAEERLAATIMARCGLGLGVSEQLLAQLNREYPSSMYQARVERACAAPRH
jgi:hypothetical protein